MLVDSKRLYNGFVVTNNDGSIHKRYIRKENRTLLFNRSIKFPEKVKANDMATKTENKIELCSEIKYGVNINKRRIEYEK